MKAGSVKHYKFINSQTGYAIYYHTIVEAASTDQIKAILEKIRVQVAVQNNIFLETIYWEEIKEEQ
jgi:hypothetical protein